MKDFIALFYEYIENTKRFIHKNALELIKTFAKNCNTESIHKKENIMIRKFTMICSLFGVLLPFANGNAEEAKSEKPATVAQRTWKPATDRNKKAYKMTVLNSARGCAVDEGFYFTADFLYWKANDDTIYWARTISAATPTPQFGSIYVVSPDWKPAFRVGLGWNTNHDNWDVYLNWTWYNNSTTETITSAIADNTGLGILALWSPGTITGIDSATYNWRLRHNMFDVEMGRRTFITRKLIMRPFASVRGGWINRKFTVRYNSQASGVIPVLTPGQYTGDVKYWGVGPRFGSNNEWYFGYGIRAVSDFAMALLYGEVYENSGVALDQITTPATVITNLFVANDRARVVPNIQLFLGFGWAECFCSQDIYLSLKAGWEVNKYWNLPQFINPFASEAAGAVDNDSCFSTQGLTFKFILDF